MNIFLDYTSYVKDNPKGYWFRRKLYGWGWTPARWQGWLATIIYLITVVGAVFAIERRYVSEEFGFGLFGFATVALIVLAWRTGEPPCWQWGVPPSSRNE